MCAKPLRNAFEAYVKPQEPGSELENARQLPIELIDIDPSQSRQRFDQTALDELADSISQQGVLEPLLVRKVDDRYRIIAGERRFRAAAQAGLLDVPVIVYDIDESEAALMMAAENLQREDLDLEDEARLFARLLELTGYSQRDLARQLGKTHNYLSRRVRLLRERPELFEAIRSGQMTQRQALNQIAEDNLYHGGTAATTSEAVGPATRPSPLTGAEPGLHRGEALLSESPAVHPQNMPARTPRGQMPVAARWAGLSRTYRVLGRIQPEAEPLEVLPDLDRQLQDLETLVANTRRAVRARMDEARA